MTTKSKTNGEGQPSQLAKLAKPFPDRYVKKPPQGKYGSYVEHSTITQALLATVGPYSFHIRQVLRGFVAAKIDKKTGEVHKPELHDAAVGVIAALTLTIDGREVTVEEVGDCEDPHNWPNDGSRLKDAMSDALKRCAMRMGLGLHLWAQEDYFLHESLSKRETDQASA